MSNPDGLCLASLKWIGWKIQETNGVCAAATGLSAPAEGSVLFFQDQLLLRKTGRYSLVGNMEEIVN